MRYLMRLVLALQFLTRIPIRANINILPGDMGGSFIFYPLVGALVGGLSAALGWGLGEITGSAPLGAGIAVLGMLLLTGGFHLDGLGDAADGLYGGRGDKERTLEIMKDSRVGAMAAMAIAMDLILRTLVLAAISPVNIFSYIVPILACTALGRLGIATAAAFAPPAGTSGLSGGLLGEVSWKQWLGALVFSLLIAMPLLGILHGLILTALAQLIALVFTLRFKKKLGGLTGDLLGLINEVCELGCLIAWLILGVLL